MKKILLVFAVVCVGMVSCKKEEVAQPSQVKNTTMGAGSTTILLGMD